MEIAAFIIFGAWVLKQASKEGIEQRAEGQGRSAEGIAHSVKGGGRCGRGGWILVFPVAMIVLTVLQIVPLPDWLLGLISPSACRIYKTFANDAAGSWRTISIYPDATIQELFKLLSYTSVFFVVINHYRTKAQVNSLVRIIIYMGCFLAVFAVLQKMTWNGRLFWFYPLREGLTSNMGYIWGPYINHNHFAGYMEMAIPLAIGFLLYKRSRMGSLSHIPLRTKIARLLDSSDIVAMALLSLAVVTMSAALFLSLSRGGMIGFTASMFFLIGIMRTSRTLKKKAGLFALLGLAVFFVVVLASWDRIEDRFEEIGKEQKIMRPEVWADTVNMVKDFPILGTGLGTFGGIYPHYQTGNSRFVFEHAENDYIEILTDTGIIGFIIIIGMASLFFYSVIKAWRFRHNTFVKCIAVGGISSCVAIAVHSFTDFNMRIPANALLLTVIAGITYAAVYNVSESREHGA
ncbi:MAG: O-antigen ligase family protein [Candidatus Subteraquimicrobiales bacterium]|nr:O-antigen ligase family protein [Candidatus Subteraquimicrobiales bacterium]